MENSTSRRYDFLILGGGIAGTTAAETIRKNQPTATIAIATDESERLYSRVLLPHFLRQKVALDQLYLRSPESYAQNKIELLISHRAKEINMTEKSVSFESGEKVFFGKLLIATGGHVRRLEVPGSGLQGIFYLRTIADVKAISEQVSQVKKAVVIGGGFIALEFIHAFGVRGLHTVLLVREPYFWQKNLDEQSGKLLERILSQHGIEILVSEELDRFEGEWNAEVVVTKTGQRIEGSIFGVGVGIECDLSFTGGTGLLLDGGGVVTDEYLATNLPDVWAAGDVAYFEDVVLRSRHRLGNWTNSMMQGQTAGHNMSHSSGPSNSSGLKVFETVSAYSISFFDANLTFLGDTDRQAAEVTILRGNDQDGNMAQIFFRGGVVVGATLINRMSDRAVLSDLIKGKIKIGDPKVVSDLNFDLSGLKG